MTVSRKLLVALLCGLAVVAVPVAVLALTSGHTSALDHQTVATRHKAMSVTGTWVSVPGVDDVLVCARGEVRVSLSVNQEGGAAAYRVLYDDGPALFPSKAVFDAAGATRGFSFDFALPAGTFEGSDSHAYTLQARHVSGPAVTLHGVMVDVLYHVGSKC